jgi:queuine/archaeosine tRNA-ribosyltransferase
VKGDVVWAQVFGREGEPDVLVRLVVNGERLFPSVRRAKWARAGRTSVAHGGVTIHALCVLCKEPPAAHPHAKCSLEWPKR